MDDARNILTVVIAIVFGIIKLIGAVKKASSRYAPEAPAPRDEDDVEPLGIFAPALRQDQGPLLDELAARARVLGESCRRERANGRFVELLVDELPARAARLRAMSALLGPREIMGVMRGRAELEVVLDEVDDLVRQRRDPTLMPELGDADALADACYAPVIAHARAAGLPLTTGHPAAELGDFDLAIWTGFIPTRIAPIFLPRDFFLRVSWWPALAHEIGHDYLASVRGLDEALRRDLGIGPGDPWNPWFEELFADIFGAMMLGPAFAITLREHLGDEPDATGCDPHPRKPMRMLAACEVLARAGFHRQATELRGDARPSPRLTAIVERLYMGPLSGLGGCGLRDVSGLQYRHAEHAAAMLARESFLAGRVPGVRDPRLIIAGAVMAWSARPEDAALFMRLARAAIPGKGTLETRLDAFSTDADRARVGLMPARGQGSNVYADALVLREVLARPRALRRP